MLIRRADEMEGQPVAMDGVKDVAMRIMVGIDDGAPSFAMRHVTVEPGGHTPHHSHNYEHEVYVIDGQGSVEYDGELHTIQSGDALLIKPNIVHQFTVSDEAGSPLKFLCFVPKDFDCGGGETQRTPGS